MIKTLSLLTACALAAVPVFGDTVYTSSAAYAAATAGFHNVVTETYSSGFTNGQDIPAGQTLDGITYSNFTGGYTLADITNQYNSFSGLSLGADNTVNGPTQTFFYPGQDITLTFSGPVNAAGVFFNVNLNSGNYGFTTNTGASAFTGSAAYDTNSFVFAGLTSATPFTSITLSSTNASLGSYNVPEIEASSAGVPEPSSYAIFGVGLAALLFRRRLWARGL